MAPPRGSFFLAIALGFASLVGCHGCKKPPALRLTYAVDVGAAYDGEKDVAKVMQAERASVQRRLDVVMGPRSSSVTAAGTEVMVDLADMDANARSDVESIIGKTGRLELTMVDDATDFFGAIREEDLPEGEGIAIYTEQAPNGVGSDGRPKAVVTHYARMALAPPNHAGETLEACRQRFLSWMKTLAVPADRRVAVQTVTSFDADTATSSDEDWRTFYLVRHVDLDNDAITDASAQEDREGPLGYHVAVSFDAAGARRFEALTAANVRRRLAVVLDDIVESAPVIQAKIPGGHASISMGRGDPDRQRIDAHKLELVLRSGALAAPMQLTKEEVLPR